MSETFQIDEYITTLIDAMELAKEETSIRAALQAFVKSTPFRHYCYTCASGSEVTALTSLPTGWENLYYEHDYRTMDPVVSIARRNMKPFAWNLADLLRGKQRSSRFFRDAQAHGLTSGFTMPIAAGFGRTAMLTISGGPETTTVIAGDITQVAIAVSLVHANITRIAAKPIVRCASRLSGRETMCLVWASLGKTNSETAQLLDLAECTVRFYLVKARDKLGAKNIAHAIRLAVKQGFI